ncbi:MAG: PEGA domain-containing protein [Myxococcales bacterium]|nr:PEGA domain-containing protein [Myxococcales bacterium]
MEYRAFLRGVLSACAFAGTLALAPLTASAEPAAKPVAAQAARDPAAKARAQKHFERGVVAFKDNRFKDAVDAFLDAHREFPSPALSYNAARAYDKLLDAAGALRFYREYLRQTPDASDRANVDKRIGELESKLQTERGRQQVTILSNVAGATVRIDDQPVGVAPWTGEILPGKHRVKLSLDGYQDAEEPFELDAHRAMDVSVTLEVAVAAAPGATKASKAEPIDRGTPQTGSVSWMTWTAFGVGAVALGGAAVFEVMRSSAEEDVKNEPTQVARHDAFDKMESRQKTARIFAGVGAVAVVAGGVLLALDLTKAPTQEKQPSVGLACLPGSCAATFAGRF